MTVAERLATMNTSCADCCARPRGLRDLTWPAEWYHPKQRPWRKYSNFAKKKNAGKRSVSCLLQSQTGGYH